MANTTTDLKLTTYAIIPGFAEGRQTGTLFRKALEKRGFTEARNLKSADIIIAHSGGCLCIPKKLDDKVVLLTNPSPGPKMRWFAKEMAQKIWWDYICCAEQKQLGRWARKTLWNGAYLLIRPHFNWYMIAQRLRIKRQLPTATSGKIVVINSKHDPWANTLPRSEILDHPEYTYITYPGSHDQIWLDPEMYASNVQSWYESRLLAPTDRR